MHFIEGINRHQMQFLSLDDMIGSDNPIRIIDEFVDKVDLQTIGVASASCNSEGRPPFHPSLLLKLYLYGYLNRVRVKEVFSQSDGEACRSSGWLCSCCLAYLLSLIDDLKLNLAL